MYTEVIMPDGSRVRLEAQDGPPTVPGSYLCIYADRQGNEHNEVREVRIDGTGNLDYGPASARVLWLYRIETIAPGGGLIRGATVDGDAIDQRGEGAGVAEPSTPGREVSHRCPCGEGLEPCPDYSGRLLCDPEVQP
jgi:hypothetical protein